MTARLWNQARFRLIHGQSGNQPCSDDLALAASTLPVAEAATVWGDWTVADE